MFSALESARSVTACLTGIVTPASDSVTKIYAWGIDLVSNASLEQPPQSWV